MNNYGVLLGRRPTDYVAGAATPIPYVINNPTGNWVLYAPSGERQSSRLADSFACVSYSLENVIESQTKFYGQELNFADRWLAKMSNTTPQGNYLWAVADTVRLKGLVPETLWPPPSDFTWDSYYAAIPPAIQSKGLDFLKYWKIAYEWVDVSKENLSHHLKQSPLQIVIATSTLQHAVCAVSIDGETVTYLDSYSPFIKTIHVSKILDCLKVVVTRKDSMKLVNDNGTIYLVGPAGKMGIADGASLNKLKQIDPTVENGSTAGVPQIGTMTHDDAFVIHS